MPLRTQYLNDVQHAPNLYASNPCSRVAQIYQTARKGGLAPSLAQQVWKHLLPLHSQVQSGRLPVHQGAYDQLVINTALNIQATLQAHGRGGFGIGQKIVNLFMKDHWALGSILPPHEKLLHAPLDRTVLGKLDVQHLPKTWTAWTKVVASGPNAVEVANYLDVQRQLRVFH